MKKEQILNGLAILGILCCIELAVVYYQANYNPYAEPSFCNMNSFVDCDSVAQTSKAVFLGIPLTYWGFVLYFFILMLLHVDTLKNISIGGKKIFGVLEVFKNPSSYISALGLISFAISIVLAITSIFQIGKICILCFVTYFINLAIGIVSTDFKNGGVVKSVKDSVADFISGVREKTVPFITAVIIIGLFLGYTTTEMPFASKKQSIKHYMFMKHNPYKISGNILGNPEGKLKVDLYSDFVCPVCYSYNIMLHKLVRECKDVIIIHHHFPLDTECNPYLETQMHKGACRMARYSIAAENQGKYWDMATALYENQPKNDKEALALAEKLGLDTVKFKKDIYLPQTRDKIRKDIDDAISLGLDGTPNIIINGNRYFGAKAYYELKDIILKNRTQ
ncbi:MAG: DsbA family protein [Cyanobacteria bacterium RUI128]|nr:DsbA family protein [Cyanobacteria bacterium RUI128]